MTEKLIGILGGGQLARMLALAGIPYGFRFRVLDPKEDAPAAIVAEHIVGDYSDPSALDRFAAGVDVITYEFENVSLDAVERLAQHHPVYPPPQALANAQDRWIEKQFFAGLDIPTAPFANVSQTQDIEHAIDLCGVPALLKTRRMGYDGKGQAKVASQEDLITAWQSYDEVECIGEQLIPFDRELSLIAVRSISGEVVFYPLVENTHHDGILRRSIVPAPHVDTALQHMAETYARRAMEAMEYVGVLAIEWFQVGDRLLANEMAPRVHNSGHWSIEGAETSQFANHLRAILGLPIGSTALVGTCEMNNIIGTLPESTALLQQPNTYLHIYGKTPRAGRKIGHITAVQRPCTSHYL